MRILIFLISSKNCSERDLLMQSFALASGVGGLRQVLDSNPQSSQDFGLISSQILLGAGLEPARHFCQRILSPLCLPFHHPSAGTDLDKISFRTLRIFLSFCIPRLGKLTCGFRTKNSSKTPYKLLQEFYRDRFSEEDKKPNLY